MIKEEEDIEADYKWELSRKEFIRSLLIIGVAANIPFLTCCETKEDLEFFDCTPLSPERLKVLQAVQLVLFPKEGNGPSALQVNADKWIVYVLNDAREPQREKDFIESWNNRSLNFITRPLSQKNLERLIIRADKFKKNKNIKISDKKFNKHTDIINNNQKDDKWSFQEDAVNIFLEKKSGILEV